MDRNRMEQFRLALFGRMVMGVAHEVDNHLSVILGFAELAQISGGDSRKTMDNMGKILSSGERINRIVRHFSFYVRPHLPVREPFRPSEMVGELLTFSRYDLGRNNVVLALPESYPEGVVIGDRRDIALALLALLVNGAEAMTEKGGTLRMEVLKNDGLWNFAVTDEGPGIPPGNLPRIFEEGYTSKDGPYNAGMGLPVAQHLAKGMGGALTAENLPDRGVRAVLGIPG